MFNFFKPKIKKPIESAAQEAKKERKYFEVFGDALNQIEFYKTLTLILAGLVFFLILTVRTALKKPPLVIRVDQLGETQAVRNVKSQNAVSGPEISNFVNYFLQYWTAWNFYTFGDDLGRAMAMTTKDYRHKLEDFSRTEQIPERIKRDQIKIKLTASEMTVENDTPQFVQVKVKGFKEVRSYQDPAFYQEVIFESTLTLKKVERTTATPWGLLVDNWSESLYKK